jgi:N-glycosylase/DNA lyase
LSEPSSETREYDYSFFNPEISINSGQMFLWEKHGLSWYGTYGKHILKLTTSGSVMQTGECRSARNNNRETISPKMQFYSYPRFHCWERQVFRLDDNLSKIISSLSGDMLVSQSINKYPGLRLMRQNPFQCMVSFACASNTSIPMIRRMLKNVCQRFGKKVILDGNEFFSFPPAERLNQASNQELLLCGLGYRTKAVKAIAQSIVNGSLDIDGLMGLSYEEAKDELMKIYGIGNKIADCILLFSLEKLDSFPIDVWITRVLYQNYGWFFNNSQNSSTRDRKVFKKVTAHEYSILSKNAREYFGKYSGYAQQYLFYNIRQNAGKKW